MGVSVGRVKLVGLDLLNAVGKAWEGGYGNASWELDRSLKVDAVLGGRS